MSTNAQSREALAASLMRSRPSRWDDAWGEEPWGYPGCFFVRCRSQSRSVWISA